MMRIKMKRIMLLIGIMCMTGVTAVSMDLGGGGGKKVRTTTAAPVVGGGGSGGGKNVVWTTAAAPVDGSNESAKGGWSKCKANGELCADGSKWQSLGREQQQHVYNVTACTPSCWYETLLASANCTLEDETCGNGFSLIHVNNTCNCSDGPEICAECANDFKHNFCEDCQSPANTSCEKCGMILKSCYIPCFYDIKNRGTEVTDVLKVDVATIKGTPHQVKLQFNKSSIYLDPSDFTVKCEQNLKHANITDLDFESRIKDYAVDVIGKKGRPGESCSYSIQVDEELIYTSEVKMFVFTQNDIEAGGAVSIDWRGYYYGAWGHWGNWSRDNSSLGSVVKRSRECYSDPDKVDMDGSDIEPKYCVGSPQQFDHIKTKWDLTSGVWSQCETMDPATCGHGYMTRTPSICLNEKDVEIEVEYCQHKPISTKSCYALCNGVCDGTSIFPYRFNETVQPGMFEDYYEFQISNETIIIDEIVDMRVCPENAGGEDDSGGAKNFLLFSGYHNKIDYTFCNSGSYNGTYYAVNGSALIRANVTSHLGSIKVEMNMNICSFPKFIWKDSECNTTCGNGTAERKQVCVQVEKGGEKELEDHYCIDDKDDTITYIECTEDCTEYAFGNWSEWGNCSGKCGANAIQTRNRPCYSNSDGIEVEPDLCKTKNCSENETLCTDIDLAMESKGCYMHEYPCIKYSEWSGWDVDGVPCGNYTEVRKKLCLGDIGKDGRYIIIDDNLCIQRFNDTIGGAEYRDVTTNITCYGYSMWSLWSECSASCGTGIQNSSRDCLYPDIKYCNNGERVEWKSRHCNTLDCPINGQWSPWSPWSTCSVSCGNGIKTQQRICNEPSPGGEDCPDKHITSKTERCETGVTCPGLFTGIGSCAAICRPHDLVCNPDMGGLDSSKLLKDFDCASDTPSSKDYDPSYHDSKCHGFGLVNRAGHEVDCNATSPDNSVKRLCMCDLESALKYGSWSVWGECSTSCRPGFRTRSRQLVQQNVVGNETTQTASCGPYCPKGGNWGEWGPYNSCSVTCGLSGVKSRYRACNNPKPEKGGTKCPGYNISIISCPANPGICPLDGKWSEWGEWSACNEPCGDNGKKMRYRTCDNPIPEFGGRDCEGESVDEKLCEQNECIPVEVNVNVEFTEEKYTDGLSDRNSPEFIKLQEKIQRQVEQMYKGDPRMRNITVEVHDFKRSPNPVQKKKKNKWGN